MNSAINGNKIGEYQRAKVSNRSGLSKRSLAQELRSLAIRYATTEIPSLA